MMSQSGGTQRRIRSWRDGSLAALRYERKYPKARKATRSEDIYMHVDYWHGDIGVDVKGNNLPDEIWVELKNVRGEPGWVFGQATYIAFDMPEVCGFVFVEREELKQYCKQNVDFSQYVEKNDAYKKCYRRKDRKDIITLLALSDLQDMDSYQVVNYCTTYSHPGTGWVYTVS